MPTEWKFANVVPLYKSGDSHDMFNYRPISLCSTVGKILEKLVSKHLVNITDAQHVFIPKRSCITQLTTLYHEWVETIDLPKPPRIDVIFLDWSKAFDRVSHKILLDKLHKYGICGSVLNWFYSYLSNRSQRVIFKGSQSNWAPVHSGVPQGSVLRPLLFNIFAFVLPLCVQSHLRQYADDTVLYWAIRHEADPVILQNDLNSIITWCNLNHMSLNVKKCKLMTVTRSKHPFQPIYKIGSDTLEIVNSYKYLGIIISSDLDWKLHINSIVCKTSKLSGFIRRVVKSKDPDIFVKLYCSLCRPILEYAAPVWCPCILIHKETLERVQRRFTRSCLGVPRRSTINPDNEISYPTRCIQLGLPFLLNRIHFLSISFVIKCLYNCFDINVHRYIKVNTRHVETVKFHHQRSIINALHHSLFYRFPRLWEGLPLC